MRLDPTGNILASEQIGTNGDEQPEPNDEDEDCQHIHQEVAIGKAFLKEQHGSHLPLVARSLG
jgi:hypothetical protein